MNCKQGDLAVIVKAVCKENIGKLVVVTAYQFGVELSDGRVIDGWLFEGPKMKGMGGVPVTVIPDDFLRPIRDNDGEDEMLRIAGLPNKQPEVVL